MNRSGVRCEMCRSRNVDGPATTGRGPWLVCFNCGHDGPSLATCESCGTAAKWLLRDGSKWCDLCHRAAGDGQPGVLILGAIT